MTILVPKEENWNNHYKIEKKCGMIRRLNLPKEFFMILSLFLGEKKYPLNKMKSGMWKEYTNLAMKV